MSTLKKEQQNLDLTLSALKKVLKTEENSFSVTSKSNRKFYKEMIRETSNDFCDFGTRIELSQYLSSYNSSQSSLNNLESKIKKYRKMIAKPYFGRIDFKEEFNEEYEKLYIGIGNLFCSETLDILIYDWRAPISNLFYENRYGEMSYNSPDGKVTGYIYLKRQFVIENNTILNYYDHHENVNDSLLLNLLSKNTSSQMHQIIETIQKKQNEIIRSKDYDLLLVQGVPGSGKSIVALHRIAYLLYHSIKSYNKSNILIFSPNDTFSKYISEVLPELGEDTVKQYTYQNLINDNIGNKFEEHDSYLNRLMKLSDNSRKIHAFKGSKEFYILIKKWFNYYLKHLHPYEDIYYFNQLILKKEDIRNTLLNNHRDIAYQSILDNLKIKVFSNINYLRKTFLEKAEYISSKHGNHPFRSKAFARLLAFKKYKVLKRTLDKTFTLNAKYIYESLIDNKKLIREICDDIDVAEELYTDDTIKFDDLHSIVLIDSWINPYHSLNHIKHVVIDESQDYNYVQYTVLKSLFKKAHFTVLGDTNQTLYEKRNKHFYNMIREIMNPENANSITLDTCYRSTREITEFTNKFIDSPVESFNRSGDTPKEIFVSNIKEAHILTSEEIDKFKQLGSKTIACIVHTMEEANDLYEFLHSHHKVQIVDNIHNISLDGILILPVYYAKGLEFDGVIYINKKLNNDFKEHISYVACTRALHTLSVFNVSD